MDDKLISTCKRKPVIAPLLIRLSITCASLLVIGWISLKFAQNYGAMRIADDGNEFAGPALGFVLGCNWVCILFLGAKYFITWLHSEITPRKDKIIRLGIYTQHLDVIYKHCIKTYYWTNFKEHSYMEIFLRGLYVSLHLTTTDETFIMLDSQTYNGWKQGVAYLNTIIPPAIALHLIDSIHIGNSVEIFPYVLDAQGISGEGKNFLWRDLIALHRKPWGDCELAFKSAEDKTDTVTLECENTNVYSAPYLIRHLASDKQNEIPILLDPAQ
ncbi:MAG: hypothetical protein KF716_17615 [Anaerolineae bacterium]|nr:hypothetical protein [Anaerolineae bacterium]